MKQQLKGAGWLLAYLVFISVVSYLGSSGFGGHDFLKYPYDFLVIIVASLFFYVWAVAARVDGPDLAVAAEVNADVKVD